MAPKSPRSRSTTSASTTSIHRPKSRQSTTSIQSASIQPVHHYQHTVEPIFQVQSQPSSAVFHGTPEEMITRSSHQLTNPNNVYAIDPSLQTNALYTAQYSAENSFGHTGGMTRLEMVSNHAFEERGSQGPETRFEEQGVDENGGDGSSRRKKGSASSQANDNELRRLYRENQGRDLNELATQVLEKKSEKTKQIFGMLWLSAYCKRSNHSVPRNRVFSHYATRCGNERVPPLNPASFGKLVRIIFPGITTRRLGVRGESKYHYVELSLTIEDQQEPLNVPRSQSVVVDGHGAQHGLERPRSRSQRQIIPADSALFPPPDSPPDTRLSVPTSRPNMAASTGQVFMKSNSNDTFPTRARTVTRMLKFPSSTSPTARDDGPLQLPSIEPYLPTGADPDAVRSLTSVYRTHCTCTIDNFRFCKSNEFFEGYKTLCGLLTVPGLKLLMHPNIAPWIAACEWLKYQKMMPVLDGTVLSQVPTKVMTHMDMIRMHLCDKISECFQNQPAHVRDAMLGPATIFTSLLQRMLRVHRSAIDVAGTLNDDAIREQLWSDWVYHVDPHWIVSESLIGQDRGYNRVLHILTQDVREILAPLDMNTSIGAGTIFDHNPFVSNVMPHAEVDVTHSFVDRLAQFLGNLPFRFPGVEARELVAYVHTIGNCVSKNLSLNGAVSLASWWRIWIFLGEMGSWLAEKGGFLEFGPETMTVSKVRPPNVYGKGNGGYGFESASDGFGPSRPRTAASTSMDQQTRFGSEDTGNTYSNNAGDMGHDVKTVHNPCHPDLSARSFHHHQTRNASNAAQILKPGNQRLHSRHAGNVNQAAGRTSFGPDTGLDHDDSGIGMGLDDDFGIEKFNGFIDAVHGSDPADVVVC